MSITPQTLQRGFEGNQVNALLAIDIGVQLDLLVVALVGAFLARVIDEDVAHQPGCQRDHMGSVCDIDPAHADKAQDGIVDEVARREGNMPLAPELGGCDGLQFGVEQGDERVARGFVSASPADNQLVNAQSCVQPRPPARLLGRPCCAFNLWQCEIP